MSSTIAPSVVSSFGRSRFATSARASSTFTFSTLECSFIAFAIAEVR